VVKMSTDKPRSAEELYQLFIRKRIRQEYNDSSIMIEQKRAVVIDTLQR